MKNRSLLRALVLVLVCALTILSPLTAGAANVAGDINNDGQVTVFDLQLLLEAQAQLRQLTTAQQQAAEGLSRLDMLKSILGTMPGSFDSDGDGIIEIYSASGLQQIAEDPSASYKLMNDIDMANVPWMPLAKFTGNFDGNGKTISNINIPYSVSGLYTSSATPINQGFFGDSSKDAVIRDLNLRNVTLTATADAQYMGLVIGSNRGTVENVTATGTIIDTRSSYEKNTYIGVLAGRICSASDVLGSVVGGTGISITDDAGVYTTTGLCADVKLRVAARDTLNNNAEVFHKIGLVGWAPADADVSGLWVETSNDTALLPASVQANRATVIAHMNAMGTVTWTPSEDLTYQSASGIGTKTYYANKTYTGLPYNTCNGSMERFQSALNPDGTTKTGLGNSIWDAETGYTGFTTLMGNNCTHAIGWAWMRITPVNVAQNDSHGVPYHGGAYITGTLNMLPSENTRTVYGVYPVGDWEEFSAIDPNTGKKSDAPYDTSLEAYHCTDEIYTLQVLEANGADTILEAYGKAYSGDAIITRCENYSATVGVSGHARMIVADPIVIRNADGSIDPDRSYMITTEQGASTGSTSTWRVNYRYKFRTLLDDPADSSSTGYARTYLPVTIRALHDDSIRGSYVTIYSDNKVTAPDKGKIYSNFRIISTKVTVKDGENVIYSGEIFTGTEPKHHSGKFQSVELSCHGEAFAAAAQAADLQSGTYTFSLQTLTADGKLHNTVTDRAFTYTAE